MVQFEANAKLEADGHVNYWSEFGPNGNIDMDGESFDEQVDISIDHDIHEELGDEE